MFGTDLTADYAAAAQLGVDPRACYLAGLRGALCDEPTRDMLRQAGYGFDWSAVAALPGGEPGNHPAAAGHRQPG
jgi:aminodeoxyfutalosine deaminase